MEKNILKISQNAWKNIAPFWPLENLIACNPLQGFENMAFEEALKQGSLYFEQENMPPEIEEINILTIKWCQAFFDQGQSTIKMPNRHLGLYNSWLKLAKFDEKLHKNSTLKIKQINSFPNSYEDLIYKCLEELDIAENDREKFLTLMLTTLPGWASYIKYLGEWKCEEMENKNNQIEYLAMRLAITNLIWPEAKKLMAWHNGIDLKIRPEISQIIKNEEIYQKDLIEKLSQNYQKEHIKNFDAQFVLCIDVRSESMRRAIESKGNYETFGFAGFFGVPIKIKNETTKESYSSCPVLLKPKHDVIAESSHEEIKSFTRFRMIRKFYQSLKYGFSTPFILAEAIGIWSGSWMAFLSLAPKTANKAKNNLNNYLQPHLKISLNLKDMSPQDQLNYAKTALKTMGLTTNFAPIVVLCAHGSTTENNAYASALNCGACGGNHGGGNAQVLAMILNNEDIRQGLALDSILIPQTTKFIAAIHDTTTDEIKLYATKKDLDFAILEKLKIDLKAAKRLNSKWRLNKMEKNLSEKKSAKDAKKRSVNWAETRPEWGLARNASFIVANRNLSKDIDLDGRSFLHSYNWWQDKDGSALNLILTAPMVVAQWINSQYFFSTINNIAYGSGSKITQNIAGKIGIMQGNASDLMHGLPLQSVFINDKEAYHQPLRLTTFIYAPKNMIDKVIENNELLHRLFSNKWVYVFCLDPITKNTYSLESDLTWKKYN
jgi:uncharacterized protein YbcC (UPF0753/DUF2309 family)